MQKFDTLIPLALAEADRLIATGNKARDGDGKTNGSPPRPPAYVQVKRAQSKRKPKQLRFNAIRNALGS